MAAGWLAAVLVVSSEPLAALARQWPLAALVALALLASPHMRPASPRRRSVRDYWYLDGGGAMGD